MYCCVLCAHYGNKTARNGTKQNKKLRKKLRSELRRSSPVRAAYTAPENTLSAGRVGSRGTYNAASATEKPRRWGHNTRAEAAARWTTNTAGRDQGEPLSLQARRPSSYRAGSSTQKRMRALLLLR